MLIGGLLYTDESAVHWWLRECSSVTKNMLSTWRFYITIKRGILQPTKLNIRLPFPPWCNLEHHPSTVWPFVDCCDRWNECHRAKPLGQMGQSKGFPSWQWLISSVWLATCIPFLKKESNHWSFWHTTKYFIPNKQVVYLRQVYCIEI